MTPQEEALRDAFLAELWPVCPEEPRHVRKAKRDADLLHQYELAVRESSTVTVDGAEVCENETGPESVARTADCVPGPDPRRDRRLR